MNKFLYPGIALLLVVGIGIAVAVSNGSDSTDSTQETMVAQTGTTQTAQTTQAGSTQTTQEGTSAQAEGTMQKAAAQEVSFVDKATTQAFAKNGGKVVYFFHASWCPSCKAAQAEFDKGLGAIPAGTTIVKTDYDTTKDLQKEYGVTYQHTFVQVDENGNKLKVWNGGAVKELVANLV
jgi:thiol-disulfide isomerase/thioredoxin